MKKISLYILFLLLISCRGKKEENVVTLKEEKVIFPDASTVPLETDMNGNAKDIAANCQTCHTARYIEMQPKFSRKTWQKTVDKMIHAYGAPIDSATAIRIVDYLSAL